ncbi:MAG: family 78 glycoside hydrolase catalytic domain [Oscillospiraceae bacterium]|nr:family 78 glycoside hydrolase catalytic domain [Oscillospiraceae bacterium]
MRAARLRTEYLYAPIGLGAEKVRLMWNCEGGREQTAYEIAADKWQSGKIDSAEMCALYGGKLSSRERVNWRVRLWDEHGKPGEWSEASFEMGLLDPSDWAARWISGAYKPEKGRRYPVDLFRKEFAAHGNIVSARLYATARGVYDVTINGTRLESFILAPGITDYRRRIQYQVYDVTSLIKTENSVTLRLADGWYRGSSAAYGVTNVYGDTTSAMAQLEITTDDGKTQTVCTDSSWAWCSDGEIRFADLKDGEIVDFRMTPTFSGRAREVEAPKSAVVASDNVPVTEHEHFKATRKGNILDFGQNIAGYVALRVRGERGTRVKLTLGEVVKNGKVDLSGIREARPAGGWNQVSLIKKLLGMPVKGEVDFTPRQEIVITCSGGEDIYKTSFSIFGFRYAEIEGEANIEAEAIAVYSDMEETGRFNCSNELVNKLVENTHWSMKSNFLDIPTDCPTRERLGWTGDAQIFFDTGAYLMDTAAFFKKWLRDMQDAQLKNGLIPAVLPYEGVDMMYTATGSSVGWADAIYLIPYRYWKRYGDRAVLDAYWPMIKAYAEYLKKNIEKDGHYEKGVHLGEWLEPEEFRDTVYGAQAKHPEECTAYLFYSMRIMAEIADEVEPGYAIELRKIAENAKSVYPTYASLDTDRQAKLVRPLALGLLDGEEKKATEKRLKSAVENYRFRVGTGFLSTPFILGVLTEAGESETAYKMLENTEKPGWLGEVLDGATTIWENWEGNLSQNHYSPGAVVGWLFDTVCGIRADGERHFTISPVPGGTLTHAEASYLSPYGTVKSAWEKKKGAVIFRVSVPSNCTADIKLGGKIKTVAAGEYEFTTI